MECVSAEIVLPREAMGLGDVKFMGAIGTFIGWTGAIFSLAISSLIGATVGVILILARKREQNSAATATTTKKSAKHERAESTLGEDAMI